MGRDRTGTGYISLDEGREHVLVLKAAGIVIPTGYEVHHIDGDKRNNVLSNLQVVTRAEHMKIHSHTVGEPDSHSYIPITCPVCNKLRYVQFRNTKRPNFTGLCKSCNGRRSKWAE